MKLLKLLPVSLAVLIATAQPVWACPYCDSDVGREVAAGIFNDEFAFNAVLTLLPMVILLIIVALIHVGTPWLEFTSPPAHRGAAPPDLTDTATTGAADE